jgi:hypothetical protein
MARWFWMLLGCLYLVGLYACVFAVVEIETHFRRLVRLLEERWRT